MNIFFIGTTEFGLACFEKIKEMGYHICGCAYTSENIIVKRNPEGIKNATYIDFKEVAERNSIHGLCFEKSNQESFINGIVQLNPDLIVVAGWHYMLSSNVLSIPTLGTIGLHASLLPRYRGGSPLVWQMINGENEAGITLFYLEERGGVDTGHVIGQEPFFIEYDDTIRELIKKSQIGAIGLLEKYLPMIKNGTAPKSKQNETLATHYKQRIPSDGEINWGDSPENIRNFIRAQTKPYPGAFTFIDNKKVIIWDAEITEICKE